jgi:glutathione S-transferase
LKGRPPGTPKSDDPEKRKRQRTARQRDLCDVKIKITEFSLEHTDDTPKYSGFEASQADIASANNFFAPGQPGGPPQQVQPFGVLTPSANLPLGHPGAGGKKYYTIQRVNGNGGNQKADGVAGPHKHTLEYSDQVKKNSVQRWLLKEAKEKKKTQVSISSFKHTSGFSRSAPSICMTRLHVTS